VPTSPIFWSAKSGGVIRSGSNYVMRLESERLGDLCRSLGFDRIASFRYLVKYGHPPGRWLRVLDRRHLFAMARAIFTGSSPEPTLEELMCCVSPDESRTPGHQTSSEKSVDFPGDDDPCDSF